MQCSYFDAGVCRSCTRMGVPYEAQLSTKEARVRGALSDVAPLAVWEEPRESQESRFRNKAKLVVGGTTAAPTLGILDAAQRGVDLSGCGLYVPGISAAIPHLAAAVTRAGLVPYDVRAARGELKYLLLTETPDGEFLLRYVLRSTAQLDAVRADLPTLLASIPGLAVVSANLQPEHKAIIEGPDEVLLTDRTSAPFRINDVTLQLGPRAFFQTNTEIAASLYRTARRWLSAEPGRILDLYCGVGGFAIHLARADRLVHGIEVSAEAIEAARHAAGGIGDAARGLTFEAADATGTAGRQAVTGADVVVVNPPRRGIGADLATELDASEVRTVLYSSCNVESLARDLARLRSFRATRARLFDMFPQTDHHEVMILLERDA